MFITLKNVSLEFNIHQYPRSIKKAITGYLPFFKANKAIKHKILDNISLDINDGEKIGIIGNNGSGKTTLLRLIDEIYEPTSGIFSKKGKVCSLLGLGHDTHPLMTGEEYIKVQLLIYGCYNNKLIDEIIEFSELNEYVYRPINSYSSGMLMRLFFSIVTNLSPEILVLDEWLSVGDLSFSKKAQKKMNKLISKARIIIIASHDLNMLTSFCTKIICLEKGKIIDSGNPKEVISRYKSNQLL